MPHLNSTDTIKTEILICRKKRKFPLSIRGNFQGYEHTQKYLTTEPNHRLQKIMVTLFLADVVVKIALPDLLK